MSKSKPNNIVKSASELFDDEVKLNNKYNAYEMLGIKDLPCLKASKIMQLSYSFRGYHPT